MCRHLSLMLVLMITIGLLAGCGSDSNSETTWLAFESPMNVDSDQRFHVSLGVRNVSEDDFGQYEGFNGQMTLRDDAGTEFGRIQVATLWELVPGEAGWPAAYAGKLPAGAYQLTWGAPEFGSVTVDFTVVELDGWLYLGLESIQSTSSEATPDEREYGPLQSLVDLARVNLAQRLGVEPEAVTVQSVEEAAFPDASLGVPEPDKLYAQVLTPGYSIKLIVAGQTYEYRASDERLVFVPTEAGAPQGDIPIEGSQVIAGEEIVVYGQSTLPEGTCLGSELRAGEELQAGWPDHVPCPKSLQMAVARRRISW